MVGGPAPGTKQLGSMAFNPNAYDHVIANKGSVEKEYKLITPPLGQGAFGEVRKAIHKASGLERAVKIIYKDKSDPVELAKIKDEVRF
jgi:calcium-dependent protein kinase